MHVSLALLCSSSCFPIVRLLLLFTFISPCCWTFPSTYHLPLLFLDISSGNPPISLFLLFLCRFFVSDVLRQSLILTMCPAHLIRFFTIFFPTTKHASLPNFSQIFHSLTCLIHVCPLDLQYLDEGRHQEALVAWRNATLQKATHVNAWNNMAILLGNLGKSVIVWKGSIAIVILFV